MYKVMLIDDDVPVVDYMKKLIPWSSMQLDVCASAYCAEEALELYEETHPDIVLTDIGLPDGNGIDLALRFRADNPQLRVVFLTCHEDFQYIKQAMRLDADDYIVKEELNADLIARSVQKAKSRLAAAQTDLDKLAYKNEVDRNRDVLLQQLFYDMVNRDDPHDLVLSAKRLGVDWEGPAFSLALCHLEQSIMFREYSGRELDLVRYAAYNIASELTEGGRLTPILHRDGRMWLIGNGNSASCVQDELERFEKLYREKIRQFLKLESVMVRCERTTEIQQLKHQLKEILQELDRNYYEPRETNSEGIGACGRVPNKSEEDPELLSELAVRLNSALKESDRALATIYLGTAEKKLAEHRPEPENVREQLVRFAHGAFASVHPTPLRLDSFCQAIRLTVRLEEAVGLLRGIVDLLLLGSAMLERESRVANPDLRSIDSYIQENIYRNVTSIDIARFLHLNPSYFSRYFKKLSGSNFTDYVHLLKMDEAKRLLAEENETAENAAYMLGYSDRAYFSKVFKKYTGRSPSDFKQQQSSTERNNPT